MEVPAVAKKALEKEEKPRETTVEFLASMADTLLIGDHVFVNRQQFAPPTRWLGPVLPYRDVRRQDIVVFLSPSEQGLYVVKRIIGVSGDHIHLRDGLVFRNGEKLDEPYVIHSGPVFFNPYRDNFPAVAPSDFDNLFPDWEA